MNLSDIPTQSLKGKKFYIGDSSVLYEIIEVMKNPILDIPAIVTIRNLKTGVYEDAKFSSIASCTLVS